MDQNAVFDKLCSKCHDVFPQQLMQTTGMSDEQIRVSLHSTIRDLKEAAEEGCHICSLLYGQISWEDVQMLYKHLEQRSADVAAQFSYRWKMLSFSIRDYTFWKLAMITSEPALRLDLHIVLTHDVNHNPRLQEIQSRNSACNTNSKQGLDQIRTWLKRCHDTHGTCNRRLASDQQRVLPSRLIDIGPLEQEPFIKLIKATDLPRGTQYIALSHCWGGQCSARLTKSTASGFFRQIQAPDLPKTFMEVLMLARELGIIYLWIDALCIFQDSKEDWRVESSKMLDVYSNATLTVAATASENANGGLFHGRSPLSIFPCHIPIKKDGLPCRTLVAYLRESKKKSLLTSPPLDRRAWAFQERVLSRRTLRCDKDQLYWDCCCLQARETFPNGIGRSWNSEYKFANFTQNTDVVRLYKSWDYVRETYAQLDITFHADRLPAFSGVARKMYELTGASASDYLAGLGRSRLDTELSWTIHRDSPRQRPREYCAPTWSWASTTGGIVLDDVSSHFKADILEAMTFPLDDPYGQIARGHLLIRAKCCVVRLVEASDSGSSRPNIDFPVIEQAELNSIRIPYSVYSVLEEGIRISWDGDSMDTLTRFNGLSFHLAFHGTRWGLSWNGHGTGFVLKETRQEKGQYQRVGFFQLG